MNKLIPLVAAALPFVMIAACGQKSAEPQPAAEPAPAAKQAPASAGAGLPATTANAEARAHYDAGWDLFENSRFLQAHERFLAAAAADPSFAIAHLMAAATAPSTEAFTSNLRNASQQQAGASRGEQLLIQAFERAFAADTAGWIAALRELTELHPDSPRAWMFLGNAYANVNDSAQARAAYSKAIEIDKNFVPGHINLGNNFLTQEPKDFAEAEKHFVHAIAITPDEPNPHDLLGDVHRAQNNLEAAYDDYTKAAELAPELGSGYQQRGHVNSFLGNYEEARDDYSRSAQLEKARGASGGGFFLVYRAYVHLHEGNLGAAVEELRDLAANADTNWPDSALDLKVNALSNAALIATEQGDEATAKAVIADAAAALRQQAEDLASDDLRDAAEATIAYMNGLLAARMGDTKGAADAASAFESHVAASSNPRKLERMHEILGMAAFYQDEFAAAIEHLSKGDHLNNMYTKYYLARANEAAGNVDEAARLYGELAVWNFNGPGYAMFRNDILERAAG